MNKYRIAVIGDVHGQKKALNKMLRKLEKHGVNRIISVGDLVDRGPDSQGCVEIFRTRTFKALDGKDRRLEMVLGNHEDSHIRTKLGIAWPGEKVVFKTSKNPEVFHSLKPEDWAFLLEQEYVLYDRTLNVTVLHGGVMPEDQAIGWMNRDRASLLSRTGYVGPKGERLKPYERSSRFWTDKYDGRFGRVVYGHSTFSKIRFTKNTVGVDGSKLGKLFAVVIGLNEKDVTFEVEFPRPIAKPVSKAYNQYKSGNGQRSFWDDYEWDSPKSFARDPRSHRNSGRDRLGAIFAAQSDSKNYSGFEASDELIRRVNKK